MFLVTYQEKLYNIHVILMYLHNISSENLYDIILYDYVLGKFRIIMNNEKIT